MKKFFEKHDLIKISLIMILLTLVLTWAIPQGYFNAGELVESEITRIGIFDFFTYGLLGMYYFTVLVTFLFVLGGFYQFLSSIEAYQKLTSSIAKKIKGKEIIFSLVISYLLAVLASMVNEYYILIAFLPFIITILSKAKLDKISIFASTFGSLLVGVIGSIISSKIVGMNVTYFGLKYSDNMIERIILFIIAFTVYSVFNALHISKSLKNTAKEEKVEDLFENSDSKDEKNSIIPIIIVGIIAIITVLLAYLPWKDVFQVEWFTNAYNWVTSVKVFNVPIFSYILGNVSEFGAWDIFGVQIVMLLSVLVLKLCYKKSFNDVIESFGTGFKKTSKLVVILLLAYIVLEFTVMYPVIPTIISKILGSTFNIATTTISGIITGLFTSEYQYTANILYSFFTTNYANDLNVVALILQSTFGLVSFVAPTSAILFIGLSYLDIPYKDWIKHIWKFLLIMLGAIILVSLLTIYGIDKLTKISFVVLMILIGICSVALIISLVALWKIFKKAGRHGWEAIIPFYNIYVLFKVVGLPGLSCLLLLIPIVNIAVMVYVYVKLAKAFGKSDLFTVGLIFLDVIFMMIIAFDKSKYTLKKNK
ncbi:MAG: hypothetical protein IJD92_04655 [Bacilli bacterium]|nr:hypothetical protein [Bacilli bacterium]